tara:strand:- start:825 stop:1544 length:720 start_codon:yes stop_codon:yes gene_type:complete
MIKAKKSLSQNFIIDKNICKKIVKQTNINNKIVIEIGPGYGFLTDILLINNPKQILLIEKDSHLVLFLKQKYKNNNKVKILNNDVIEFDFSKFKNVKIISNLPYNISTKIILYLFNFNKNISEMVFMIQKEVALKFDYNLIKMNKYKFLTKIVSTFSICFDVSPKVFIPKPKVYSSVVKFKFNKNKFDLNKANVFANLIFKNVRKKIYNNLRMETKDLLLHKRIDQLSIDELLTIYKFF